MPKTRISKNDYRSIGVGVFSIFMANVEGSGGESAQVLDKVLLPLPTWYFWFCFPQRLQRSASCRRSWWPASLEDEGRHQKEVSQVEVGSHVTMKWRRRLYGEQGASQEGALRQW